MIMRRTELFLTAFLLSTALYCQTIELGIQSGIGTYGMKDLKLMNQSILHSIPFSVKMTSDFPPFLNFEYQITYRIGKLSTGFVFGFQSTGSRISGKDYSGELRYDLLIRSYLLALDLGYTFFEKEKIYWTAGTHMGIVNSRLRFEQYFQLGDSIQSETLPLISENFFITPEFRFGYKLKHVKLELSAGYFLQLGKSGFHDPGNSDMLLYLVDGKLAKPGWNGLRAGLACVVPLFQNIKIGDFPRE
jgi:hypothetical protein